MPVRIVNDAVMQALGSYEGGRMLFIGLGTGLGSTLVIDEVVVPLELGGLPASRKRALAEILGDDGRRRTAIVVGAGKYHARWASSLPPLTWITSCSEAVTQTTPGGAGQRAVGEQSRGFPGWTPHLVGDRCAHSAKGARVRGGHQFTILGDAAGGAEDHESSRRIAHASTWDEHGQGPRVSDDR